MFVVIHTNNLRPSIRGLKSLTLLLSTLSLSFETLFLYRVEVLTLRRHSHLFDAFKPGQFKFHGKLNGFSSIMGPDTGKFCARISQKHSHTSSLTFLYIISIQSNFSLDMCIFSSIFHKTSSSEYRRLLILKFSNIPYFPCLFLCVIL